VTASLIGVEVREPSAGAAGGAVWLVRHAPTAWTGSRWCGRSDPALTDEGRRVAAETADGLAAELPVGVAILSSPLRRARATAEAIAARAGASVELVAELAEVDFGRIEGLTWGELSTRHPDLAAAILAGGPVDWPGGETAPAVADRAKRAAALVRACAATSAVMVVSHGRFLHVLEESLAGGRHAGVVEPVAPGGVIRVRLAGREGNG
jgi:broad specificity phosphatase PhoE